MKIAKQQYREPWERQVGEGDSAWEAFVIYRDSGAERSLRKTAQMLDKANTTIAWWSNRWKWVERTHAWDMELDRIHRAQMAQEYKKAKARFRNYGKGMQAAGMRKIQKYIPTEKNPNPEEVPHVSDAIRLVDSGTRTEARGFMDPDKQEGNSVINFNQQNNQFNFGDSLKDYVEDAKHVIENHFRRNGNGRGSRNVPENDS